MKHQSANVLVEYLARIACWDWGYHFCINPSGFPEEPYLDLRHIHITGKLLCPKNLAAQKVALSIIPRIDLNKQNRTESRPNGVGYIDLTPERLGGAICMPQDALNAVLLMLSSEGIRYISLTAPRLKRRKAIVSGFSLKKGLSEDDLYTMEVG